MDAKISKLKINKDLLNCSAGRSVSTTSVPLKILLYVPNDRLADKVEAIKIDNAIMFAKSSLIKIVEIYIDAGLCNRLRILNMKYLYSFKVNSYTQFSFEKKIKTKELKKPKTIPIIKN